MNNRERFSFLLQKYIAGTCSRDELEELFSLVNSDKNKEHIEEELKSLWLSADQKPQSTEAHWDSLYKSMMQVRPSIKSKKKLYLRRQWGIAASILIVCAIAIYVYQKNARPMVMDSRVLAKTGIDHDPGGNKAVLILDNGTRVLLDAAPNGAIAKQTGVQITKTADGQLIYSLQNVESSSTDQLSHNTIETPKGGEYQITMPDGTKVWLNAQSSLKYPTYFNGKERRVELSGEAYFEVKHQKNRPFKVVVNNQLIEVLGTHFNVNGYNDESSIRTTLLEGAVKLSFKNNTNTAILKPGQQSIYQGDQVQVNQVDIEQAIAWKKGYFAFNKSNLEDIMRQISRWYNVEVTYQENSLKKEIFSGSVSRFEKASQVLSILELTGLVNFKIEEGRITVMP